MFHKYEPFLKEIKCTFHLGNELITTNKERLHEENEKLPIAANKCHFASSTERKKGDNCGVEGVEGGA